MANTKQARKRARQSSERRVFNRGYRSMLRTYIKRVDQAIQSGDKQSAVEALNKAEPIIDRVARKGLIHKNKAARHKSRFNARIKQMAA